MKFIDGCDFCVSQFNHRAFEGWAYGGGVMFSTRVFATEIEPEKTEAPSIIESLFIIARK